MIVGCHIYNTLILPSTQKRERETQRDTERQRQRERKRKEKKKKKRQKTKQNKKRKTKQKRARYYSDLIVDMAHESIRKTHSQLESYLCAESREQMCAEKSTAVVVHLTLPAKHASVATTISRVKGCQIRLLFVSHTRVHTFHTCLSLMYLFGLCRITYTCTPHPSP